MSLCLNEIWADLTRDLNGNKIEWWNEIMRRFTESKRKYHNVEHLETKYKLYLDVKRLVHNQKSMEYALFFSYFEYQPYSVDGDERNVDHFKSFCNDCGVPLDSDVCLDTISLLRCIGSHITEEHKTVGIFGNDDKHYFLDLDMAILGSDPDIYSEYTERVKEEYDFIPTEVYNALRVKVLQTFVQIPNIFATKEFREKFEQRARRNIQDEIERLQ